MNDFGSSPSTNPELRVLILPSTQKDFELTREILNRAGIQSMACSDPIELCKEIREGVGAVMLAEEVLARDEQSEVARYIAEQPSWSDLPLLVLARPGADSALIAKAMDRLGNVTVLERPLRIVSLVSAVRSALRARMRQYQVREDAKALKLANDELEHRVKESTAELREANVLLKEKIRETAAAEQRAHQLLRELVTAQETERARIARDLHDELGQQLTSLRLHLSQIDRELPKNSKNRRLLATTTREAERIDSRVSFLAWMIRPTTIEDLGLAKALRGYVREWSRNFDVDAEFGSGKMPTGRLLPEIEVNAYRIAQECLNNVAKYADAKHVSVLLTVTDTELTLIVEDDGKGFNPTAMEKPSGGGGLGLRGMNERANLLQGTFEIESRPGAGTTVFVRIPAKFRSES
jgi:signal transduction histidine kinase